MHNVLCKTCGCYQLHLIERVFLLLGVADAPSLHLQQTAQLGANQLLELQLRLLQALISSLPNYKRQKFYCS